MLGSLPHKRLRPPPVGAISATVALAIENVDLRPFEVFVENLVSNKATDGGQRVDVFHVIADWFTLPLGFRSYSQGLRAGIQTSL